jgi:large subunit ribosomal protein L23
MALFGKKKTENKEVKKVVSKSPAVSNAKHISTSAARVVIRPHITEKTGMLSQSGVYTFQVVKGASSQQIAEAIEVMYKVVPVRVSVTTIRAKKRNLRGIPGMTASGKKAYVYLKKGDTIEFI